MHPEATDRAPAPDRGGRLRALVTNDDGISSEGLRQLALAARSAGLEVVVAAPREEASGTGAALTALQSEGRIVVEPRSLEGLDGVSCYAVAAAPGFIARIGCRGAFGPEPDVVLSGINRGANTGHAIIHSGTVGAALTAHLEGRRALAISCAGGNIRHWGTAAHVAVTLLPHLLGGDDSLVLNVNVPDVPASELRGLRSARLAAYGAVQTTITEVGKGYVKLGVGDHHIELHPDSDAVLLGRGFATVTVLEAVTERTDVDLPELDIPRAS